MNYIFSATHTKGRKFILFWPADKHDLASALLATFGITCRNTQQGVADDIERPEGFQADDFYTGLITYSEMTKLISAGQINASLLLDDAPF